jgi:hypothetical protein
MSTESFYTTATTFDGGAGGAGTAEKFDYDVISTKRASINGYLNDALTALNEGTSLIDSSFGSAGTAMTGSGSNAINNKWNELETVIRGFKDYIDKTLDNINTVSNANKALEEEAMQLFNGSDVQ